MIESGKDSLDLEECKAMLAKAEEALDAHDLTLNIPLNDVEKIRFEDIFDLEDIQRLQDEFAVATGTAALITSPEGIPITRQSNFTRLCSDIVRRNEIGRAKCMKSDAEIGQMSPQGLKIQPCLSAGLWNAGSAITVGGKHIANWLIGQIRNEQQAVAKIQEYARLIKVDENDFVQAFLEVPTMPYEQFGKIAKMLHTLSNLLSKIAYQNAQQSNFINVLNRTKDELTESEGKLRTLIQTIPDLVWLKDQQEKFLFCNSTFEEFFGMKEIDMIGKTAYDLGNQKFAEFVHKYDNIALSEGKNVKIEERILRKGGGGYATIETIKTPMYRSGGQISGVLSIGRDISERKQAEEERKRLEEQARQSQRVEAIGRLAGGVAHDLNNLLTPILAYSDILMDKENLDESTKKEVSQIAEAGLRARDLVKQLLAYGRKQPMSYEITDLNAIINNFMKLLRSTIRENIEIKLILLSPLPTIKADIGQVEQVLMNLAVNAADAMPEGGVFSIETAMTAFDESYTTTHFNAKPGDYIMLSLSDTGCGIDDETLNHVFEPFYSTKGDLGTGLGLSTVYGIVKQHEGYIFVYSEIGKGTTFKVYFPVYAGVAPVKKRQDTDTTDLSGVETILLVEDHDIVRNACFMILKKYGYHVLVSENSDSAIEKMESHSGIIHLLLTDLIMPGMNGKELHALAMEKQPHLKALFMSGYTKDVIATQGFYLDEDIPLIQKPFSSLDLAKKVREVLNNT